MPVKIDNDRLEQIALAQAAARRRRTREQMARVYAAGRRGRIVRFETKDEVR